MFKGFRKALAVTLHWPMWGVLLCVVANTLVWVRGNTVTPSVALLLFTSANVAIVAGMLTPAKPMFTTFVIALSGPFLIGHTPFALSLLVVLPFTDSFSCDFDGIATSFLLLCYGIAFTYVPYWLLVHAGWLVKSRMNGNPGCKSMNVVVSRRCSASSDEHELRA